uniref:Uncharacterized protein n=1 Tax=Anguilla anguilla TaxID=7936 RepID=A0A0E9R8N4_ANGAN
MCFFSSPGKSCFCLRVLQWDGRVQVRVSVKSGEVML